MSRSRALTALALVLTISACSDSESPLGPTDDHQLTLQPDQSVGVAENLATPDAGAIQLGSGGKGREGVRAQTVGCVHNRFHEFCVDIRRGHIRAASADATAKYAVDRTRGQIRVNGVLVAVTNRFGKIHIGDKLFANYPTLNILVFRGDIVCHQFPKAAPQVCGIIQ